MEKVDYFIIQSLQVESPSSYDRDSLIREFVCDCGADSKRWKRPGIDYLITESGELQTILPESSPTKVDLWGLSQGSDPLVGITKHIAYAIAPNSPTNPVPSPPNAAQAHTLAIVLHFYSKRFPDLKVAGFDQIPMMNGQNNPGFDVKVWLQTDVQLLASNLYSPPSASTQ